MFVLFECRLKIDLASLCKVKGHIGLLVKLTNTSYPLVEKLGGIRTLMKKRVVNNYTCGYISAKFNTVLPVCEICKGKCLFSFTPYYDLDFVLVGMTLYW